MENMGINQLAQMYMGNPQPLAQKVQQAQKNAKPGQIPPDLEEAMALQKIQEVRNAFGNQQALQAGGPQPTVVDQLKQMLAPQQQAAPQGMAPGAMLGMAPQAAPQMPQVRAARGGSIESLRSNLGSEYYGGGIVAFAAGGDEGLMEDSATAVPSDLSAEIKRQLALRLMAKPEDAGIAAESGARSAYGAPDTTGYDRAVAELEKRRSQFEAPKTGMPALMEYLSQIAQAPRGMGSLSAGAMGAQRVEELQKQREGTQFDLTKQILEQEQKKMESGRGYAKEMHGINKAAVDQAYKMQFDAAKELGQSDMEAKRLAQTAAENEANRQNNLLMERERAKNALAIAGMPGSEQKLLNEMEALRLRDPAAYKAKMETHAALKSATGGPKGQLTYDQAVDNVDKSLKENKMRVFQIQEEAKNAGKPVPTYEEIRDNLIKKAMEASGSTFMKQMPGTSSAATPSIAPAPDAISYLKQNPSLASQFDAKYGAGASAKYLGR